MSSAMPRWLPDLTAKMVPLREGLEPLQMLTSDSQVAEWQNERLPSDQISVENGGILTQVWVLKQHGDARNRHTPYGLLLIRRVK